MSICSYLVLVSFVIVVVLLFVVPTVCTECEWQRFEVATVEGFTSTYVRKQRTQLMLMSN